jgi:hypothetical protein
MGTAMRASLSWRLALALLLTVLSCDSLAAAGIKLYLKDGSYQRVKTYQVQGNRVRYYSLERGDWEEIPKSLVDFPATDRARRQQKAEQRLFVQQARRIETERFDTLPKTGYQIKPGIGLPATEGVYLFDGEMVWPLVQSSGEVERDKKRLALSLALPAPLLKGQSLVVLEGARAAVRVSVPRPVFFIEAADNWGARAELIPLKVSRHQRLVEKIQSGIGLGKSGELREKIPLERTQVAPGIVKLTPAEPLTPGEYALGELLPQGKLNINVWDFDVNGGARSASDGK